MRWNSLRYWHEYLGRGDKPPRRMKLSRVYNPLLFQRVYFPRQLL